MRRSLSLLFLVLCVISLPAFADGVTLFPNSGGGDNFAYNSGDLHLFGGTDPFFLYADGYLPGTIAGGGGGLFLYSTVITVDGVPLEFYFNPGSIYMTSFQLPTNGRDFIAAVTISFDATGINYDTGQTISVGGGDSGWIGFNFSNGRYYPGNFVQGSPPTVVPEPGALGLVATGIIGILASARGRLKLRM